VTSLLAGRAGIRSPAGARNFFASQNVHIDFGAHSAVSSTGTACSLSGIRRPGCEFDASAPSGYEFKNERIIPRLPLYIFMVRTGTAVPVRCL